MQTQNVSAELEMAMQKIDAQGKQPTVALVKANLTSRVPMPAIIAAIKNWKNNKPIPKIEIAADEETELTQRITELETQVATLIERVNLLEGKK